MSIAYTIVERSGRKHPFTGKTPGRSLFFYRTAKIRTKEIMV